MSTGVMACGNSDRRANQRGAGMAAGKKSHKTTYGMGAVAKITGLTDHTIRVWERRYKAVEAGRLDNGRRVFTPHDVEKLGLLKVLTDKGVSIGSIAGKSVDELRAQARESLGITERLAADRLRVAVFGDFLPGQLRAGIGNYADIDLCIADSDEQRFLADVERQDIDVVVAEFAVLDAETIQKVRGYLEKAQAKSAVLVYRFGRTRDIAAAESLKILVVRAPITTDEFAAALTRAQAVPRSRTKTSTRSSPQHEAQWQFDGPVAPRRFSQQQLANLANVSSTIDCECPQHLAQLVSDLSAFEVYSGNCASRDDEDAALHRYLHKTTAQARALVDEALERVAVAEGIDY